MPNLLRKDQNLIKNPSITQKKNQEKTEKKENKEENQVQVPVHQAPVQVQVHHLDLLLHHQDNKHIEEDDKGT